MTAKKNTTAANLFPHVALTSAELLALVRGGKIDAVRRYFDTALYGREIIRPVWEHLRAAAESNDVAMARLLRTWGASAGPDDLRVLVDERGEKATRDLLCLRMAGFSLYDAPVPPAPAVIETPVAPPEPPAVAEPFPLDMIPQEWKTVLQCLQQAGGHDAMIAGGALRDIYNARPVKDVDIFLGERWMSKRLIKKAFAAAGLTIHDQMESTGYGQVARKMTRGTKDAFNEVSKEKVSSAYSGIFERERVKEGAVAWTVIAGPDRTEYNIVFIKNEMGELLKREMTRASLLIGQFDIGICQIAFDGRVITRTAAYDTDVREKKLTLVRPNHSSKSHLQRVFKKYDDFTLCPAADKLLHPEKHPQEAPKKPAQSGYGYVSKPARSSSYGSIGFSGYSTSRSRGFSGY